MIQKKAFVKEKIQNYRTPGQLFPSNYYKLFVSEDSV